MYFSHLLYAVKQLGISWIKSEIEIIEPSLAGDINISPTMFLDKLFEWDENFPDHFVLALAIT
jgi:hypothetical protein